VTNQPTNNRTPLPMQHFVIDHDLLKLLDEVRGAQGDHFKVPQVVLEYVPIWDFIVVLEEQPMEVTAGGIHKPSSTVDKEAGGSGWLISIGPDACLDTVGCPDHLDPTTLGRRLLPGHPNDWLGRKMVFGKFAGDRLPVLDTDDDWRGRFKILKVEHLRLAAL
jgi:hypothetical protein